MNTNTNFETRSGLFCENCKTFQSNSRNARCESCNSERLIFNLKSNDVIHGLWAAGPAARADCGMSEQQFSNLLLNTGGTKSLSQTLLGLAAFHRFEKNNMETNE